jgi:hypothetical protein
MRLRLSSLLLTVVALYFAEVASAATASQASGATASAGSGASLEITKIADASRVEAGNAIGFRIGVTSHAPS